LRALLAERSITCSFKPISVPPKAVCSADDQDIAQFLLREGWAVIRPMSEHPSSPRAEAWESGVTRRPSKRLKGRAGFGVSEAERLEGVAVSQSTRDQAWPKRCRPTGSCLPLSRNGACPAPCSRPGGIEKHWDVGAANGNRINGERYSNAQWSEMAWADGASDD